MATTNVCKLRPVKKLRIRLISGHHLPKIAGKIKGNVIQPYVKIKIRGHIVDQGEYMTEVVPKVSVSLFDIWYNFYDNVIHTLLAFLLR